MNTRTLLVAAAAAGLAVDALDNGLGLLPPLAWRSWNAFHENFNQSTIHDMVDAVVAKRNKVDGVPTSLQELGYDMIGIDEGWEGCGMGVNHTQHYVNGTPAVRKDFPDLKALVDYGHSKGVKMGFYLNGCSCGERTERLINYEGDVAFTHAMGFDGVKIDSCGVQRNMTLYAELFNKTGRPILIENCHQGQNMTDGGDPGQMGDGWCPYNSFRTSGDIINVWDRVVENLMSVVKFLTPPPSGPGAPPVGRPGEEPIYFPPPGPPHHTPGDKTPLTRPGCWAYPDMLEVGRMEGTGQTDAAESAHESASHFAAWTMVSAPLVLGFDLTNTTRLDLAWPTISNKRAMAVSQSWEGDRADPSGALVKSWQDTTKTSVVVGCSAECPCEDKNPKCAEWAKQGQCVANPGYMHAMCGASCPSSSNSSGWKIDGTSVTAPNGDCLDTAGQLTRATGSGLNWLRTAPCDPSSATQKWAYTGNTLKSLGAGENGGLCIGVQSHWLWDRPMVSLMGCGNPSQSGLTLNPNGTLFSHSGFGCVGVSNTAGPLSSLWRKPMAGGRTAVLAINGAALPAHIEVDVATVLAADGGAHTEADAADIWTGKAMGAVKSVKAVLPPHGNLFIVLSNASAAAST